MRSAVMAGMIATALSGCATGPEWTAPAGCPSPAVPVQPAVAYANPTLIPVRDPQCAWEQVVDVVDDYFRIEREEPVRIIGNTLTEGNLVTVPEVSPTVFEPWRQDTGDPEQRVENTLQTMRRRAVVRVIPAPNGHWIDVAVFKELENLPRPEFSRAGAATFRYDTSLTHVVNPVAGPPPPQGWIPRGRDTALEQRILADLMSRGLPVASPVVMRGQSPR